MINMILTRIKHLKDRTLGRLDVGDKTYSVLEPPWLDNRKNVSCIPVGTYTVRHRKSNKYGKHLIVEGVPNRSLILIHVGNYPKNTQGCILVGLTFGDLDLDGKAEVLSSRTALNRLLEQIGNETEISLTVENYVLESNNIHFAN